MDKTEIYEALGQTLRKKRRKLEMTQDEVAKQVDLSRASITNIELGKQSVLVDQLYSFAKVFHMEPRELLPTSSFKTRKPKSESLSPDLANWIERARRSA